jgi:hypothetical protein
VVSTLSISISFTIGAALGIGDEASIGCPLGMAEGGHELREEAVVAGGDDHRAVLRLETLEGYEPPGAGALARRQVARELEAGDVAREPSERRLEERGVDDDAAPGARPLVQGREHAHRRPHAGTEIQHGSPEARGRIFVPAVDAEESREGLHHRLVAGPQPARARMPEGPQGAEDQPRIDLLKRLGAESQLVDHAGAEILDEYIGLGQVVFEPSDRLGIFQIEDDGALVHVHGVEDGPAAQGEGRTPAARLVALRPLDLHDIRAHVGEDLAGERAGQRLRDLDDLDAFEG